MSTSSGRFAVALLVLLPGLIGITGSVSSAVPADPGAIERLIEDASRRGQALSTPQYDGSARLATPAPAVARRSESVTCHEPPTTEPKAPAHRYTMCVDPNETTQDIASVRQRLESGGFGTAADPVPVPGFCWDYVDRGWVNYRTQACSIDTLLGTINDPRGVPVGAIRYVLIDYAFTSDDLGTFGRQISILVIPGGWGVGLLPDTMADGLAFCEFSCDPDVDFFRPQPANFTSVVVGNAYFDTTVSAPGDIGYAATTYHYVFHNPAWIPIPVTASSPPLVRCDNALPGVNSVGCVFSNYTPIMQYARDGRFPELARHIGDAQESGLPGGYPGGRLLTRLTDPALRDANGDRACPRQDRGGYPRPPTKSCDEYPFRSTYQGAATADPQGPARTFDWCQINEPARTGPLGYSVCMIDAYQNSQGGLSLGSFYNDERVLDRDAFLVWITGTAQGPNPDPPDYPPTADAGPDVAGFEGYPVDLRGSATDDRGAPSVRWSYTPGPDTDPGALCRFSTDSAAVTSIRCTDDGTYTVTISADDGIHDQPTTDSATVRLENVTPQLRRLIEDGAGNRAETPVFGIVAPQPWQVFRVGDDVALTVNFDDTGENDTHTCAVSWDDGTSSTVAATGHACQATHRYTHAGMYTIRPAVTDDDGGRSDAASVLIIVYDPEAGFATGAGHFSSAPGSLPADPAAGAKTHFQFNPKYLPHDAGPQPSGGKADLHLQQAGVRFSSTSLAWLVITPDRKVALAGTGTVNGRAGFGFVLYGYETGHFRMVIWDLAAGPYPRTEKAYDNRPSTEYDLDLAEPQQIDAGRIQIH